MLVLSRKPGERLTIGEDIVLVVNKVSGNRVTLAIEAPQDVRIVRGELAPLPQQETRATVEDRVSGNRDDRVSFVG